MQHNTTQCTAAAVPQLLQPSSAPQRLAYFYATNSAVPWYCRRWLNVIAVLIGEVHLRCCGKNRSHFYLLAECYMKSQAPLQRLRLVEKSTQHFLVE